VGGIWKSLEMQARKVVECYKQSLLDDSGGNSEDQNLGRNTDSKERASTEHLRFQVEMRTPLVLD
jgi:hypothetical protein